MIGTILGNRYELLEKIGEGGMAEVYKAKCRLLGRFVAVKVLKEQYNNDAEFVEKFKKEATAAASLSHTNIVNIYDVGSQNNSNYIVMEYVKGKTLKEIVLESGKLSYPRAINIAIQIAAALECAHKNNLVHRDIKPHNILMTEDGIAKVTDFGIVKVADSMTITNSNQIIGSAHYFSPEQAKGGFVDCTTDIYSLGIVIYEMVTGKVPFDAESAVSVALKHIQEMVVPPKQLVWEIPESLNRLILKAIEKEPIKRYQTAKEILVDLNRIKENSNVEIKLSTMDNDFTKVMAPVVVKENPKDFEEDDEDEEKSSMKKSTKIIIWIVAVIIVIAIGGAAGMLVANTPNSASTVTSSPTPHGTVTLPAIIGKKGSDIETAVKALGLKYVVSENQVSDKPVGIIIDCNHKDGEEVAANTEIRVILSSGKEVKKVTDLTGVPESTAKDTIISDGYKVGKINTEYSDTVQQGSVIRQSPEADTSYEKGSSIDIVVSQGPNKISVPDLTNKTVADAKAALEAVGLKMGVATAILGNDKITKENDGKVFLQEQVSNTKVPSGTTINITIYKYTNDPGL